MSRKILIVEDDHDTLGLLKDLLEGEGYEVDALDHTDSITASLKRFQPDLVILDFLLPGVNGGELCHEIKTSLLYNHLPVIMMSGFPRVLESLGDYGADIFISKPFDISALLHAVSDCFDNDLAVM